MAWLAAAETDGDPLGTVEGRDWAVRDYRSHLQAVLERRPATVNGTLAAVDELLHPPRPGAGPGPSRRPARRRAPRPGASGPGPPPPRRQRLPVAPGPGARPRPVLRRRPISEVIALDVDDVRHSARKGVLRILGKGERVREVPNHPKLARLLKGWLEERRDWPGQENPAPFLNQRGRSLSVKAAHDRSAYPPGLPGPGQPARNLRRTQAQSGLVGSRCRKPG